MIGSQNKHWIASNIPDLLFVGNLELKIQANTNNIP